VHPPSLTAPEPRDNLVSSADSVSYFRYRTAKCFMRTTAQSQFQKSHEHVAHDFPVDEDPYHHTISSSSLMSRLSACDGLTVYLRLPSPEVGEQALLAYATNLPAKLMISSQHLMTLRPQTHSPTQYQSRTLSNPRQQHERTTTYPERSSPGSPCPR
jgi:hypothetical protein